MIRWVFFFEEGNVKTDVTKEEEDVRIQEFVDANPKGILQLPTGKVDIYINLDRVKCFCRSIIDEDAEQEANAAAIAQQSAG